MTFRGPVQLKALVWAEREVTQNVGRFDEHTEKERSHETFFLTATTPQELMQRLEDMMNKHPAPPPALANKN